VAGDGAVEADVGVDGQDAVDLRLQRPVGGGGEEEGTKARTRRRSPGVTAGERNIWPKRSRAAATVMTRKVAARRAGVITPTASRATTRATAATAAMMMSRARAGASGWVGRVSRRAVSAPRDAMSRGRIAR